MEDYLTLTVEIQTTHTGNLMDVVYHYHKGWCRQTDRHTDRQTQQRDKQVLHAMDVIAKW